MGLTIQTMLDGLVTKCGDHRLRAALSATDHILEAILPRASRHELLRDWTDFLRRSCRTLNAALGADRDIAEIDYTPCNTFKVAVSETLRSEGANELRHLLVNSTETTDFTDIDEAISEILDQERLVITVMALQILTIAAIERVFPPEEELAQG